MQKHRKVHGMTIGRHSLFIVPAMVLALGSASLAASAGSLGGAVGGAIGGVGGALGGAVGGVTNGTSSSVSGAVGSATSGVAGTLGQTKATVTALTRKGVLHATARSNLIGGIKAKLQVLSKKNLLKLCLGVGGGAGCGSEVTRPRLLGLIDYRLTLLSRKKLLALCVSVGGGCGSRIADGGGGGGGGDVPGGGGNPREHGLKGLSGHDKREFALNCLKVLQSPVRYSKDMVAVCRVIKM